MKKDISGVFKRIKFLRDRWNWTQKEFAEFLEMTLVTYKRYESGTRKPPIGVVSQIADKCQVSEHWIMTGQISIDGETVMKALGDYGVDEAHAEILMGKPLDPYETVVVSKTSPYYSVHRYLYDLLQAHNKDPHELEEALKVVDQFFYVPRAAGNISAGIGLVPQEDIELRVAFRKDWLRRKGDPTHMVLIKVEGDSMEPTLMPGDTVLVDRNRNYISAEGGIYAIALDDTIMVKRIQVLVNSVRVISDNAKYPSFEVPVDKIKVNGKVIWYARELEK